MHLSVRFVLLATATAWAVVVQGQSGESVAESARKERQRQQEGRRSSTRFDDDSFARKVAGDSVELQTIGLKLIPPPGWLSNNLDTENPGFYDPRGPERCAMVISRSDPRSSVRDRRQTLDRLRMENERVMGSSMHWRNFEIGEWLAGEIVYATNDNERRTVYVPLPNERNMYVINLTCQRKPDAEIVKVFHAAMATLERPDPRGAYGNRRYQ